MIPLKQLALVFCLTLFTQIQGQNNKNKQISFEVSGVCNQCKSRIENAALIKGVKHVEWDKNTRKLKVIFKEGKTSQEVIEQAVADHGHDTENKKATLDAYEKLPHCCAYKDGVKTH